MHKKHFIFSDIIRAFVIPGVVLIHSSDYFINSGTYSRGLSWIIIAFITNIFRTAVPLFFMISGFLILRKPIKSISAFYKKTFWRIGFPLLFWIFFDQIWNIGFHHQIFDFNIFLNAFFTCQIGILYFLEALLGIYLLAPFLQKINNHLTQKQKWLLLGLMTISGSGYNFVDQLAMPQPVQNVFNIGLVFIFYFYAGYLISQLKISKKNYKNLIVVFIISTLFSFFGAYTNLFGIYKFWGYYQMPHIIIMSFSLFAILWKNEQFFQKNINKSWQTQISKLAGLTYGIYLTHYYIIQWILKLNGFEISDVKDGGLLFFEFKLFIVTYLISIPITIIIKNIPYLKKIIGE